MNKKDFVILLILVTTIIILWQMDELTKIVLNDLPNNDCEGEAGSPELYYYKASYNSDSLFFPNWNCGIGNHTQDKIAEQKRTIKAEEKAVVRLEKKQCYDEGSFHNFSFDLLKDYNFSCEVIDYYNSHLILGSERHEAGKIYGNVEGLFVYGTIKGQLYSWVNNEYLATGQVVKNISYHIDCNNKTVSWNGKETKKIIFYSEKDFVNYYVNNCIRGKKENE